MWYMMNNGISPDDQHCYMKYSVSGDSQMYLCSVQMHVLSMPHTNMDKVPPIPLSFDSC